MTVGAFDAPAPVVLLDAADQAGVSVAFGPKLAEKTVTVDFRDVPGQAAFEAIAEQLELAAVFDGQTVTLIPKPKEAEDFAVFRIGYADPETVQEVLVSLGGDGSRVTVMDDRVAIVGSRRLIEQAREMVRQFETGPDGWRLEVRVVSVTESFRREIGLDWDLEAGGTLAAGVGGGDLVAPVLSGTAASVIVRVVAEAVESGSGAGLMHAATLYVLEGVASELNQGEQIPVPRYQTSPEGTTTVVGYDKVSTGFNLRALARRVPGGVRLALEPSISAVTGYVERAPLTTESRVKVDAVIEDGDWLVVSGLTTTQGSEQASSLPGIKPPLGGRTTRTMQEGSILFLVRADRVYAAGGGR